MTISETIEKLEEVQECIDNLTQIPEDKRNEIQQKLTDANDMLNDAADKYGEDPEECVEMDD